MTALPSTLGALSPDNTLLQLQAILEKMNREQQQYQQAAARAALQADMMEMNPSLARPFPGAETPIRRANLAGQIDPSSQGRMASGVERGGPPTGPQFNPQTGLTDYLPPHPSMPTMSLPPPSAPAPSTLGPEWGKTRQLTDSEEDRRKGAQDRELESQKHRIFTEGPAIAARKQARQDELDERQLRVAARGMGKSALGLTSERQAMKGEPVGLAGLMEMFGPEAGPTAAMIDPRFLRAQAAAQIGAGAMGVPGADAPAIFSAANRMMDPNAAAVQEPVELVKQAYAMAEGDPIEFERQLMLTGLAPAEIEQWGVKLFGEDWATRNREFLEGWGSPGGTRGGAALGPFNNPIGTAKQTLKKGSLDFLNPF
ncbi:hypothetical protein LCGC14_2206590 [marine sediment metagenome]|uniref:Uncharacterized protein n=1 Tax=marine sediment metagenome TaxID=412755 RepID=A0A0F9GAZ7_9ZZZZ|nr:hypothetical protein [Phycisphaerae bacterium]